MFRAADGEKFLAGNAGVIVSEGHFAGNEGIVGAVDEKYGLVADLHGGLSVFFFQVESGKKAATEVDSIHYKHRNMTVDALGSEFYNVVAAGETAVGNDSLNLTRKLQLCGKKHRGGTH